MVQSAEQREEGGSGVARRIARPPSLPGGRAVVGALLVAAAAVATFAAYLDATATPDRSFLVATAPIDPGTRLSSMEDVRARFGTVAVELHGEVAARLVAADAVEELVGQVVLAPLASGDLLSTSQLVADGGVDRAQTLSFALPRTAALGGGLQPGERIDVLATFGSGDSAYTAYVVRGVPLLRVTAPDGGTIGSGSEVILTVAVTELVDVQALGHAVHTAGVFVTRSTAAAGDGGAAPGAYRAAPRELGPLPDPALPPPDIPAAPAPRTPAAPPMDGHGLLDGEQN